MASVPISTLQSLPSSPPCRCSDHRRSSTSAPGRIRAGSRAAARSPPLPCSSLPIGRRKLVPRVAAPSSSPAASPAEEREEDCGSEAPVASSSSSSSSSSSEEESFSWRDHWYPASLVEDLDPTVPTPFQLLNRDIVLWKDPSTGEWVAFDDRCPHRLAPLSEGRIDEDGWLQCSYHGWSFDGAGSCRKIPQAATEGPEARAVGSPRACVSKLPTMVSQGMLFVWPDEKGWEKAAATKPPMLPDDFSSPDFSTVTIQRDLFYGYDTLMENVSDPSHIEFAHHKDRDSSEVKWAFGISTSFIIFQVTGRRDRARPLPFKMESSGAWGFSASDSGNPRITSKFIAPCYNMNKIEINTKLPFWGEQNWVVWICSFNIPMAPGKTRSIVCSARNFFRFSVPGPAPWQVVPRWYEHWTSNKVYDGDMIVLQGQEKVFLSKSIEGSGDVNEQYTKITFTPTQADRLVLAFRNWLRRYGNSKPDWFGPTTGLPLPSTILSKRQMLDRYEQHTLKCSSCKGAHTAFQTWQKILIGSTVFFSVMASIPSELLFRVLLGGASLLSASLAYLLHELEKNFTFVDYVHSEID